MRLLALVIMVPALACSTDESNDPEVDGGAVEGLVPANSAALFDYLTAGEYLEYEAESEVHVSAGPHGSGVRTFLTPDLAASLAAGASEHPVGAAAIKELYAADHTTVTGWAAMVKIAEGTAGSSWYFYEVFSTTNGSNPIEGNGRSLCTGCHSSGADFVRVGYPLL